MANAGVMIQSNKEGIAQIVAFRAIWPSLAVGHIRAGNQVATLSECGPSEDNKLYLMTKSFAAEGQQCTVTVEMNVDSVDPEKFPKLKASFDNYFPRDNQNYYVVFQLQNDDGELTSYTDATKLVYIESNVVAAVMAGERD